MDITMTVYRCQRVPSAVSVDFQGQSVNATIYTLEIELISPDGQHGSALFRFRDAAEVATAQAAFVEGQNVTLTIAASVV